MTKTHLILCAAIALLSASCGAGQSGMSTANAKPAPAPMSVHTKVYKDYAYQGAPLRKLLVLGVFADPTLQRMVEDRLSAALKEKGAETSNAYKVFPVGVELTREMIADHIEDLGIDGVLVAKLKGASKVETETLRTTAPKDGGGMAGRVGASGNDLYGYYAASYQTAAEPGFATQALQYEIVVKVFEVKDGNSIWEAAQTVENPDARAAIIDRLSKMTAENLLEQGIIGAPAVEPDTAEPEPTE